MAVTRGQMLQFETSQNRLWKLCSFMSGGGEVRAALLILLLDSRRSSSSLHRPSEHTFSQMCVSQEESTQNYQPFGGPRKSSQVKVYSTSRNKPELGWIIIRHSLLQLGPNGGTKALRLLQFAQFSKSSFHSF